MLSVKVGTGTALATLYPCFSGNYGGKTDPYYLAFLKLVGYENTLS